MKGSYFGMFAAFVVLIIMGFSATVGYLFGKHETERIQGIKEIEIQTIIVSDGDLIGDLHSIGIENDASWAIFGFYNHNDNVWEYIVNITTPKEWNGNNTYKFRSENLEDVESEVKNMLKLIGYIK